MVDISTSPHCVLTFVRFSNRSKVHLTDNKNSGTDTIKPMVVVNDCISCQVSEGKDGFTSSFSATLKSGDLDYLTAIHSGDYVIVNMVEGSVKADEIRNRALNREQINVYDRDDQGTLIDDGFKGLFKIQSVRKQVSIRDGVKVKTYNIVGYSHYFLTNKMYFIPQLVYPGQKQNRFLFFASISNKLQSWFAARKTTNIQHTIDLLLETFLGTKFDINKDNMVSPNQLYHLPPDISRLLGLGNKNRYIDLVNVQLGPQKYSHTGSNANIPFFKRFSPDLSRSNGRVFKSNTGELYGEDLSTPQQFNMVSVGDYIKGFTNDLINEMYVCHKIDPESNMVLPTIVIREKPFTTPKGPGRTKYYEIPQWVIPPSIVLDLDVGVEEAARINFVQVYGRTMGQNTRTNTAAQIALGNYKFDQEDIAAHGLRPYVATSNFDWPVEGFESQGIKNITQSPKWASMVWDWLAGGHLKLNGSATLIKGTDPIAPGDNTVIDGIVFHIERVTHSFQMSGDSRAYRVNLSLSHGIRQDQLKVGPQAYYAAMEDQNANNYKPDRIYGEDTRIGPQTNAEEHNSGDSRSKSLVKDFKYTRNHNKGDG